VAMARDVTERIERERAAKVTSEAASAPKTS
jgi:hypothetical protein